MCPHHCQQCPHCVPCEQPLTNTCTSFILGGLSLQPPWALWVLSKIAGRGSLSALSAKCVSVHPHALEMPQRGNTSMRPILHGCVAMISTTRLSSFFCGMLWVQFGSLSISSRASPEPIGDSPPSHHSVPWQCEHCSSAGSTSRDFGSSLKW